MKHQISTLDQMCFLGYSYLEKLFEEQNSFHDQKISFMDTFLRNHEHRQGLILEEGKERWINVLNEKVEHEKIYKNL